MKKVETSRAASPGAGAVYTCPMHPQIRHDGPGNCPICGFIALAGVAAETGVVMLIYLDNAYRAIRERRGEESVPVAAKDLYDAITEGAVERVRPKMMMVAAIMAGLLPILFSTGTGSEVMQRIAVPMVGGMISSTALTLLVIPAIYALVKQRQQRLVH
jgi:Cu(I)/Ag(I) efflux system membrane protein CusA/SilA